MKMQILGGVLTFGLVVLSSAFTWQVDEELPPLKIATFSERFMFGSNQGPAILPNKNSDIRAVLQLDLLLRENTTTGFQYAVYVPDDDNRYTGIGLCNDDPYLYQWARNIQDKLSFTRYEGEKVLKDGTIAHLHVGFIYHEYRVFEQGWHNIDIQICADEDVYLHSRLHGEVSFRNPYGYLPAEQWGIIPFETMRAIVTSALAIVYAVLCWLNKDHILPLHKGVCLTLAICAISAILWCISFISINASGHPYCCPFPPIVIAAQMFQVIRQTLARLLLLVVSLGYGIVRPKLQRLEWPLVTLVTFLYFISALAYEINDVVFYDVHPDSAGQPKSLLYPVILTDFIFLYWIYIAMTSTIRILNEFQQTHKLEMYDQLWLTIGIFVTQFLAVSILMSMNRMGIITWPWEWNWFEQVAWEMVNFSMIIGVAIICRPTESSSMLSYSTQLPMDDPDVDDEDGLEIVGTNKERDSQYSLPDAENDEEFGLEED